jgi:hypothetical protein
MLLDVPVRKILLKLGRGESDLFRETNLINIFQLDLSGIPGMLSSVKKEKIDDPPGGNQSGGTDLTALLKNGLVMNYLGVNEFEGVVYYSRENFEELIAWLFTLSGLRLMDCGDGDIKSVDECYDEKARLFRGYWERMKEILSLSENSEYKFDLLIKNLSSSNGEN